MNINFRPKKCSGQSRYGRYGSYATAFSMAVEVLPQPSYVTSSCKPAIATCFSHARAQINGNFEANTDRAARVATCEPANFCLGMCKLPDD